MVKISSLILMQCVATVIAGPITNYKTVQNLQAEVYDWLTTIRELDKQLTIDRISDYVGDMRTFLENLQRTRQAVTELYGALQSAPENCVSDATGFPLAFTNQYVSNLFHMYSTAVYNYARVADAIIPMVAADTRHIYSPSQTLKGAEILSQQAEIIGRWLTTLPSHDQRLALTDDYRELCATSGQCCSFYKYIASTLLSVSINIQYLHRLTESSTKLQADLQKIL